MSTPPATEPEASSQRAPTGEASKTAAGHGPADLPVSAKEAQPSTRPVGTSRHRRVQRWRNAAVAAALVLGGAAAWMAWNLTERHAALERELAQRQQLSSNQSVEARAFAKQAQDGMLDNAAKVALLEARLAEVTVRRGQLEELLLSLTRSRDENLIVDIEAEIRVAVQQNAITGSAEPLLAALKQSDERLARHGQPQFERVRRAIARDIDRVRAAGVADVSSLAIKLDETVRLVDEMPLLISVESRRALPKAPEPARAASAAAPAARSMPGQATVQRWADAWDTLWQRVGLEARSLVRVTQIDQPEAMLVAPEQAFFLKENLKLRLLNARLALLSRQFDTAQSDLTGARTTVERYFDRNAKRTVLGLDLIRQVAAQARQTGVPRPEDTLAALAAAGAGR